MLSAVPANDVLAEGARLAGGGESKGLDRFSKAAELWRAGIEAQGHRNVRSPGTLETYERHLNLHLLPALGDVRLLEFSPPLIDRFLKGVSNGTGAPTAKTCRSVVSGVLGLAVRYGALPSNPVRDADRLGGRPRREPRALTVDERVRQFTALDQDSDGAANLTLATLHGDIVTTIPIAATAATGDAAAGIDGWSDYTEYGAPRDRAATAAVAGAAGYGWLGAKQRSTTSETAGLTLMGDRLYNAATGRFSSPDPEPGGNDTAYTYPTDPINKYDLDGHWGISKKWKKRFGRAAVGLSWASHIVGYCPLAQCQAASLGLGLASAGAYALSGQRSKARSQLISTAWSLATGGRGKWLKASSRFSRKVNTRFRGLNGLAHRSYSKRKQSLSSQRREALFNAGFNHLGGYMGQY